MNYKKLFLLCAIPLLFACKKKIEPVQLPSSTDFGQNILILNEGLFQQNNASLTWMNFENGEVIQNFFQHSAGRPLGDTGNDIKQYGGKIYIVINVSSTIEILDAKTLASIKQLTMQHNGVAKQPRYIDFYDGRAFISCFDGYVDVLDTTILTITKRIKVGTNPDHLRVAGDQLYVSNSGGLNFPNVDSTVSVVSLQSLSETKKITVGKNPGAIALAGNGQIYVVSRGDFGAIPSRMHRLETAGNTIIETYPFDASQLIEYKENLYVFETTNTPSLRIFDAQNNTLLPTEVIDFTGVSSPYAVQVESNLNRIFVLDANGYVNLGKVWEFSMEGVLLRKITAGLIPNKLLFVK